MKCDFIIFAAEIDRCLKKVSEGVEKFEEIWQKVHNATSTNQKEKFEEELKKEIKKLQRLRDQIKTWIASGSINDKTVLVEKRKLIEQQMERFKIVERETKTKAYSKEGLTSGAKLDPAEKERADTAKWLNDCLEQLNIQMDGFEAEIETLGASSSKKKKNNNEHLVEEFQTLLEKHREHVVKLETILRMLDNDNVNIEQIKDIKEDVEYYIENCQDPDFAENEMLYDDIDGLEDMLLENVGGGIGNNSSTLHHSTSTSSRVSDSGGDVNVNSSSSPTTISTAISHNSHSNDANSASGSASEAANNKRRHKSSSEDKDKAKATSTTTTASTPPAASTTQKHSNHSSSSPLTMTTTTASISATTPTSTSSKSSTSAPTSSTSIATSAAAVVPPLLNKFSAVAATNSNSSSSSNNNPNLAGLNLMGSQSGGGSGSGTATSSAPSSAGIILSSSSTTNSVSSPMTTSSPNFAAAVQQQQQLNGHRSSTSSPSTTLASTSTANSNNSSSSNNDSNHQLPSLKSMANRALPEQQQQQQQQQQPSSQQQQQQRKQQRNSSENNSSSEAHIPPLLGVAPLGPVGLNKETRFQYQMLEAAYQHMPHPSDSERLRPYLPRNPIQTPAYYPQLPAQGSDSIEFFGRLSTETLFFIFYYMEGTKAQYLAARALKKQSWRFHTKYMMWFQRHEEPKIINDEFEQVRLKLFNFRA